MTRTRWTTDDAGTGLRARDVMSMPVITLPPRATIRAAAALLVSHGFSAAPVVREDGHVVGIASEADLIEDVADNPPSTSAADERTVADVMTENPYLLSPDTDLREIAALLSRTRVRSVPIAQDGRLIGIVTRRDVLRAVARGDLNDGPHRHDRAGLFSRDRRPMSREGTAR